MKMLDLFSGIGGFALAASWVWGDDLDLQGFCEIDSYCQKVLKKNFPDVPIYEDITELQPEWFDDIDLLTGGFPCQNISVAGKGEGLEGDRSGLWFEMLRLISGIRPRYALIENVPMLIHRGLERVLCDLAQIGYDAEWQIVGADDVGAWHRRKRIWIVAYTNGTRSESKLREAISWKQNKKISNSKSGGRSTGRNSIFSEFKDEKYVPDTVRQFNEQMGQRIPRDNVSEKIQSRRNNRGRAKRNDRKAGCNKENDVPNTESGSGDTERIRTDRNYWSTEPNVGRVANGIPSRVDRLKGLGNAIVPQVVYEIMKKLKLSTTAISTTNVRE